jgi:hypothetical protein
MKLIRFTIFALAVIFFSAGSMLRAQTLGEKGTAEIDELLQRVVDEHVVPGVVAVVASRTQVLYFYDDGCMRIYRDFEADIGKNLR